MAEINVNGEQKPPQKEDINITVVKEDLKKDIINFLIGLSQAGLSQEYFPQIAELITKSLSPTVDVYSFADEFLELLKRGNSIQSSEGVDFTPLISQLNKGISFKNEAGDSVSIPSLFTREPRPDNEIEINASLNTNELKDESIITYDNNTEFSPIVSTEKQEKVNIISQRANERIKEDDVINIVRNSGLSGKEELIIHEVVENGNIIPKNPANYSIENPKEDIFVDSLVELGTAIYNSVAASKRRQRQLEIFIYNIVPYGVTSRLYGLSEVIRKASETGDFASLFNGQGLSISDIISGGAELKRIITHIKYLSALELGLFLGGAVNFYTLHFRRGITIKDMRLTPPTGPGISFSIASITYKELKDIGQPKYKFNIPAINPLRPTTPKEYNLSYVAKENSQAEQEKRTNEVLFDMTSETEEKKDNKVLLGEDPEGLKKSDLNDWIDSISKAKSNNIISGSFNSDTGSIIIDFGSSFGHSKYKEQQNFNLSFKNKNEDLNLQQLQKKLNDKQGVWEIGSIYIWPITDDNTVEPKYIPFQFNPNITEGGISARYTATSILSRIGNLQSFTGTDNLTLSFSTSYVPISKNSSDPFSIQDIQLIELAYRSLVFPWFSKSQEAEGYKYYKPPLVKIIMGNKFRVNRTSTKLNTDNSPYSNLLTYPDDVLNEKITGNLRHFKTFIVTNVTILRDENLPYFLDEQDENLLKDTFGYTINMSLIEITPSYHQMFPNFKDYYNKANPKLGVV